MTKVLTYVEIDIDYCSLVYGTAPCTAALGVSGTDRCFNSIVTCQDRLHFTNSPVTLRFGLDVGFAPADIEFIPSLAGVSFTPATVSLGKDLGQRASLTCTFRDHPHSDTGAGFDNYRTTRGYDPFLRGSFWGKFRARQPYLRGRAIRLIRGTVGQAIADMTTRHFIIEDFDGPNPQGQYSITAKDVLKLADGDRAQAPLLSNGYLGAALLAAATSFAILPSGVGDSEYPASGLIAIAGDEICSFTRAGDAFTIVRAQKGTTAGDHESDDRVQLCLVYDADDPATIIHDLLVNYAGTPAAYINLPDWLGETQSYLQRLYSATIADPVDVKTLVSELIEQAALAVWWSDTEQLIKLRVLRQIQTPETFDEDNIIEGSLSIKEQPAKRVTEVWTYYGQRNPLIGVTEPRNYRSTLATLDLQMETDYGAASIVKIFSRWIPDFGQQVAERVNNIQLSRYRSPPRQISFMAHRFGDISPMLGSGYNIGAWTLQDTTGARVTIPVQIVRLNADESAYQIEAEEATITTEYATDLTDRVIIIDSNVYNFNLRETHDNLYPEILANESPTVSLTCIVNSGVIVGSISIDLPAFDVGAWPADLIPRIVVNGRIQGKGGNGAVARGVDAQYGGTAFYTRAHCVVDANSGKIWGGGGGGPDSSWLFYGGLCGGGGGQGSTPGDGGHGDGGSTWPADSWDGRSGTTEAPGTGGNPTYINPAHLGGTGGEEGQPGSTGQHPASAVGAAGNAIDGRSYVLLDGGSPGIEIMGPEIN